MKSFRILFNSLFLLLLFIATAACASRAARPDAEPALEQPLMAAALSWDGAALELPAGSPLVLTLELEELLASGRDTLQWVAADPAMFGPQGSLFVAMMLGMWQEQIERIGHDPLSAKFWNSVGIDVTRPIHAGFYPVSGTETGRFVDTIEARIRRHLPAHLAGKPLDAAIDAAIEDGDPSYFNGISADVASAVEDLVPITGMRLVVPIADRESFITLFSEFIASMDYVHVETNLPADHHVFLPDRSEDPSILLRLKSDLALVDLVDRPFRARPVGFGRSDEVRLQAIDRVGKAVALFQPGRPAAPRPLDRPFFSMSLEQAELATLASYRGYTDALEGLRTASVAYRDRYFIDAIEYPLAVARSWSAASQALPATVYGLHRRCSWREGPSCILGMEMTLFGADDLGAPAATVAGPGIAAAERGLALSASPLLFVGKGWQEWIASDEAGRVLDALDMPEFDTEALHLLSPVTIAPRNLAVFMGNFVPLFLEDEAPEDRQESELVLRALESVSRIEIGTVGLDLTRAGWHSRFVLAVIFDAESGHEDRQLVVAVIQAMLNEITLDAMEARKEEPALIEKFAAILDAPLLENAMTRYDAPAGTPLAPSHYVFETTASIPYFLFARGLSKTEAQEEARRLVDSSSAPARSASPGTDLLYLRIEPLALLATITEWRPHVLDPIDLNVLVQRLGPMIFTIRPHATDDIPALRFLFELQEPPKL